MKLINLLEAEVRSVLSVMGQQEDELDELECQDLRLESLEGASKRIANVFRCNNNPSLTSLEHCPIPTKPKGYIFNCSNCDLTSLRYAPRVVLLIDCGDNPLTSLEGIPSRINGNLYCSGTWLTSLKGIHHQIKHLNGYAVFHDASIDHPYKITSHVLGLMKIEGLTRVYLPDKAVTEIINTHLGGNVNGCNIGACQDELENEGFEEYAQL